MSIPDQDKNPRKVVSIHFILGIIILFFTLLGFIGTICLIPVVDSTIRVLSNDPINASLIAKSNLGPTRFNVETSRFVLRKGISFLERSGEAEPLTWFNLNGPELYWRLAANVKNNSPLGIIQAQLPLAALYKPRRTPLEIPSPQFTVLEQPNPTPSPEPTAIHANFQDEPTVLIYHTHTTESYIPVSGKDHLPNTQGDIVKVGAYLQQVLTSKYQIQSLHCQTIHDEYPFRDSYKRSQVSVRKYLAEFPELKVVLDVHRDATPGIEGSSLIKGVKTAKIMIVVGSDKMGLPHPHWRENLHFAQELVETMNRDFPGLCGGIIVSDARYNQQLHPHALIAEFGDQKSTLPEVYRAVDDFASTLVTVLYQENQENNPEKPASPPTPHLKSL